LVPPPPVEEEEEEEEEDDDPDPFPLSVPVFASLLTLRVSTQLAQMPPGDLIRNGTTPDEPGTPRGKEMSLPVNGGDISAPGMIVSRKVCWLLASDSAQTKVPFPSTAEFNEEEPRSNPLAVAVQPLLNQFAG